VPLKPIAPIRNPPRHKQNWNGRAKRPPEWQQKICQQAKQHEDHPEYLSLHKKIVSETTSVSRCESEHQTPLKPQTGGIC
jgi:hypothetical protein